MALTVTAGASDADSYASLAEANAYFTARGITAWTGTDAAKENALRRALSYLENQYRDRWIGTRSTQAQSLAWPRRDGARGWGYPLLDLDGFDIAVDAVPTQIKHAQIEAALLVLSGVTLEPQLVRGGMVKSESKQVGPLGKSVTYMDGAPSIDRYTVIDGLLCGLVTGTPGASFANVQIARA